MASKSQIKKLDTIIAKLEALQPEFQDSANDLGRAKALLMDALRKAERS